MTPYKIAQLCRAVLFFVRHGTTRYGYLCRHRYSLVYRIDEEYPWHACSGALDEKWNHQGVWGAGRTPTEAMDLCIREAARRGHMAKSTDITARAEVAGPEGEA